MTGGALVPEDPPLQPGDAPAAAPPSGYLVLMDDDPQAASRMPLLNGENINALQQCSTNTNPTCHDAVTLQKAALYHEAWKHPGPAYCNGSRRRAQRVVQPAAVPVYTDRLVVDMGPLCSQYL